MGRDSDSAEIIQEVGKDRLFYQNSGGGVTLSGGEPLGQPQFVRKLLRDLKERGYHTALDTCGFAAEPIFADILPYTDLVLFDIKQLNDQKHLASTGVSNRLILTNARMVSTRVRTWFRIPLIEGFNDSPEEVRIVADMARDMGVEKISFLPYHEGGRAKRSQLGQGFWNWPVRAPSENHIQRLKKIAEERGVKVSVGN
jgi:pyruvate formate lyase activating enzyme